MINISIIHVCIQMQSLLIWKARICTTHCRYFRFEKKQKQKSDKFVWMPQGASPANICWSWRRLQHVLSVTILRLARRLEHFLKTSWKLKNCYTEDVWRHILMFWRHILKTSWRHYGEKQSTYWGYLYLTNLDVYLINLYFTNLYLTILRRIQNALIRTQ